MNPIHSIEIRYFRSIYHLKLSPVKSMNVFSGPNDSGKSNILKALNLFFNSETDWRTPLEFYRDFNIRRLDEVRRETVKGKQYISVRITFNRGSRFSGSLPERFTVTRTWYRDSVIFTQKDDLETPVRRSQIKNLTYARRSLTQYLNSTKYHYIPAIKDDRVFEHVLSELQSSLLEQGAERQLRGMMSQFAMAVDGHTRRLYDEFSSATGVRTHLVPPRSLEGLYKLSVDTVFDPNPSYSISIALRGDGIRTRYIPSILNYISLISRHKHHIWGFEEPENSLNYRMASAMAEDFEKKYSLLSQILVTSHSPMFVRKRLPEHVNLFRVVQTVEGTQAFAVGDEGSVPQDSVLMQELGITDLAAEASERYVEELAKLERERQELEVLRKELAGAKKPVVLTEGKTDAAILEVAWKKLYPDRECPFGFFSCDVLPTSEGGGGGASVLSRHLESVLPSEPQLKIGLYDYDYAGVEAFSRLKHFDPVPNLDGVKIHKNRRAYAIRLPVPQGREAFVTPDPPRLCIEFYFSEQAMQTKTADGKGLTFQPYEVETRVLGSVIGKQPATGWEWQRIKEGKTTFATEIVPALDASEFEPFRKLFELLSQILEAEEPDESN